MQPVAPSAPRHQTACELVDDDDLAVLDHVVDVALEDDVRAKPLVDVVEQRHVGRVIESARAQAVCQQLLAPCHAALGERHGFVLFVEDVVARGFQAVAVLAFRVAARDGAGLQAGDDSIDFVIEIGGFLGRAGNDQRRARFVDQDAVDFVDDGEVVPALNEMRELELHVVAEVVEAELVVRAVGDVAAVGDLPLLVVQIVLDDADRHPEEAEDFTHPLRVAAGQVIVHRDDVNTLTFEGVEIGGQRRDKRFALACLHLGDLALVQHVPTNELHVEMPHVEGAVTGLAHDGKGLGQQVLDRRACGHALAQIARLLPQRLITQRVHGRL